MKKLIAMLGAVVAAVTSAWAATVTFSEGSTTNFTVINDSQNAGNYNWNNCTDFTITIPAKEGLTAGTKVLLKSIAFVKANSGVVANVTDTPSAVTIGGYKGTAVTTGTAADGWAGSNIASRNTAVYSFGEGAILTVGTAAPAKMLGITNLRACPTSDNNVADKGDKDIVIGINNDRRYQPLAKLVCEVIETTEATVSTDTTLESLESLTWSNGAPTADVRGIVTIAEEATLTISASTTLPKLTFAGAGTVKYVGPKTIDGRSFSAPFIFGLSWTGSLHLVNITHTWFDFSQFVGVDTIKMTGVAGNICLPNGSNANDGAFAGTIVLIDDGNTVAFHINDGFGTIGYTFGAIAGTGTLKVTKEGTAREQFIFKDATDFGGAISLEGANNKKSVLFGTAKDITTEQDGSIIVAANTAATIASGKTWTARNGIVVKGTLAAAGDLGSVAKGSGEIIYAGRLPTQQNCTTAGYAATDSAWAGTVTIKNYGSFNNANHDSGAVNSSLANVERLGNANSKVKFNGVHAYLPNSNLTCAYELVLEDCAEAFDGETAAWFNDNGYSSNSCTFSKLSGSGSFYDDNSGCCHLISFADVSEYTGSINAQGKRIVLGTPAEGEWVPANNNDDKGKILIASDTTMTLAEGQTLTARQGLYVNGTLVSPVELATMPSTKATGAIGVQMVHDEAAGTYTYTPEMPAPREEPCNIVVTSWAFDTYTLEDGTTPTLKIDGDTVIIPATLPSDVPAQWSGAGCVNVQGHDVIVRKDMNWKHNIGNTMTIDENVKVYFYDGNFLDGATVEGKGTLVMKWTKTISGSVTITSEILMDGGAFKLADGATLTCEELPAGKVTTDDATKVVVYEDGAYQLVDKPTVTVASKTISGLTSAYVYTAGTLVEYFSDWEANFEVTFGANIAAGDVELKGSYGEYDMQTFPMPEEGVSANTPWTLLPSSGAGSVTYGEVVGIGTFTCGVNNIKAAEGTTMQVELVLKKGDQRLVLNTQNYALEEVVGPVVPSWIDDKDQEVVAKYNTWASANGVTDPTAALEEAYLLNCANNADAVDAAKKAFKIPSITIIDGEAVVTEPTGNYNGTIEIQGATSLDGEWHIKTTGDKFFQAILK